MLRLRLVEFIGFGANNVMGLDISSSSVKAIELRKRQGSYLVAAASNVAIETSALPDATETTDNTVAAVRKCVEMSGSKISYVVCAVGGCDAAVRGFKLEGVPTEEIGYAVLTEAEQTSGLDMNKSIVDYQLQDESSDSPEVRGLLVAASAKAIHARNDIVRSANLQNVLMDVDCLAILNCFGEFGEEILDRTVAIVDIEEDFTNLIVIHNESLPFVRNLAQGGGRIVNHIAAEQDVSRHDVRAALFGTSLESSREARVWKGFDKAAKRLIDEIRETVRYYMTHERKCGIDKVFLCGDFSLVRGIDELMSEKLRMKVELWNPLKDVSFAAGIENSDPMTFFA